MQEVRSGVPMRGIDTISQKFNQGLLKAMGERARSDPRGFTEFAKKFGMAPIDLIKRVGQISHDATFGVQDILQQTLERGMARKGISRAAATEDIARTLPNYRTPARLFGDRTLGKAMKGAAWFQFPGWDVGRLTGLGNMLKGAAKLDPKSIDQLLMIAVLYEFGKQVINPVLQQATGNPNAETRAFGYGVFPQAIEDVATGKKTVGQAGMSLFPFGYVPQAAEMAAGTNLYTGKKTSLPGERPKEVMFDYAQQASQNIDPLRRLMDIQSGKETPEETLLAQFGIKAPSSKETTTKNKAIKYNKQQLKYKRKKEPDWIKH